MSDSNTLFRFEKQHLSKILWPSNFNQKFIGRFGILDILDELPLESAICDFGAGTGRLTPYLADRKFKVTNFEPTMAGTLVTKRFLNSGLNNVTLVNNSKSLDDNYFDLVISIGVIHHIKDPLFSLSEIKRITKKNTGQIIIWVYAKQNKLLQFMIDSVRIITSKLPHIFNLIISTIISILFFSGKAILKKLKRSFYNQINEYNFRDFNLMIYDQLQPPYSKYYLESELINLMSDIRIKDFKIIKHGFGMTVFFRNI